MTGATTLEGTPNPEAPNPQLPVVQKLRIRYAKRGRLRFTSHRDFARAFERAVRRSRLPIGFSSGFSPHPKISYANAAPTGTASEAEFLEIGLTEAREPDGVREALDAALPPGLDVLDVVIAAPGPLAERLEASAWRIQVPGADPGELAGAVASFLAAEEITVERMTKRGLRAIDIRGAVVALSVSDTVLDAVVRSAVPTVRPDDIVAGLREHGLKEAGAPVAQRVEQGPLREVSGRAEVGDPLRD
ncbi:MAG TPA: TIGR03936 family radical SAM-associated protein [Aeromicrobium sp.]|nr:TIGR03936 family radical SAM-associated protein [Aeromicrobium sp.]